MSPVAAFFERVLAVAGKEMRQLRRDKLTGAMIVGIPLIQILIFGYGINFDVRHIRAGVTDYANTSASRLLISQLQATQVVQGARLGLDPRPTRAARPDSDGRPKTPKAAMVFGGSGTNSKRVRALAA